MSFFPLWKDQNVEVKMYDYLKIEHDHNNLSAKILWAILGIYRPVQQLLDKNIYIGISDMTLDGF